MANGAPRRIAWSEESTESKLRLIINELDEMDVKWEQTVDKLDLKFTTAIDKVTAAVEAGNRARNAKMNWMLGTFVGILASTVAGLVVLLVTH